MKKVVLIILAVILALILSFLVYLYIWGGVPQIKNFDDVSDDYEIVAQLALDMFEELSPEEEYSIFNIHNGNFEYNDSYLSLTEEQQNAVLTASEKFGYLLVCEDAVFFRVDETGYYGLVYSDHPLRALYRKELPQSGREYHRINSHWYEWGAFGI